MKTKKSGASVAGVPDMSMPKGVGQTSGKVRKARVGVNLAGKTEAFTGFPTCKK